MTQLQTTEESIYDYLTGGEGSARIDCLARHLNLKHDPLHREIQINSSLEDDSYDFKYKDAEYKVLTNKEADKECKKYIRNSLWAFDSVFLENHSQKFSMDHFKKVQELYEDANDLIYHMIDDFDYLVKDAIATDGRGHFLGTYDHKENYEEWNGEFFYIYRVN